MLTIAHIEAEAFDTLVWYLGTILYPLIQHFNEDFPLSNIQLNIIFAMKKMSIVIY